MGTNVIEILMTIMSHLQAGGQLGDFRQDDLKSYNKSEVSAAYSWLYGRFPELLKSGTLSPTSSGDPSHRVLHLAEKVLIGKEAYGYLLRLVYSGLIDISTMEKVIERVMLQFHERLTLDKLKEVVAQLIFDTESGKTNPTSPFLTGNEKIH